MTFTNILQLARSVLASAEMKTVVLCSLWAGDYGSSCFQSGDSARLNLDRLSAAEKAKLQDVSYRY